MWSSEHSLLGLVLSFHCVGTRDQAQLTRLGSKFFYHLSRPDSCTRFFLKNVLRMVPRVKVSPPTLLLLFRVFSYTPDSRL